MSDKNGNTSSDTDSEALDALSQKLDALRKAKEVDTQQETSGIGLGLKYASEFSAAAMVGAFLGYGLDHFIGSSPWGLLVGLCLGFCAGVRNIVLSAKRSFDAMESDTDRRERE